MSRPADDAWLAPVALAFYGASMERNSLGEALERCRRAFGADTMFYYVGRLDDAARLDHHVSGAIARDRLGEYTARWARENVRQRAWAELPDGAVVDFDAVVPPASFEDTAVWQDFMRRHVPMLHAIGLAVSPAPGLQARLGLGRTKASGPFSDGDRARLLALAPHLRRAARARLRLLDAAACAPASAPALASDAFAALELAVATHAQDGRFLAANPALRRLAARHDGLALGPGGIAPARPAEAASLAAAIRAPQGTTQLRLSRLGTTVPYVARVVPTEAATRLVIVTDPAAPITATPDELAALFGLSPEQAALAGAIASGRSLAAHAAEAGIARETARSRLKAVMARTGCRRQAELAALLAALPAQA
jgi:DNA-binding CsgD family transcriptional regulator/PAS domain-containing protein